MPLYISPPPRNPFVTILATVVGGVVLVGAFMLGFVALLMALGVGAVLWLGILVRIKWVQHRLRKQGYSAGHTTPADSFRAHHCEESLEAEYTVVSTEKDQ